MPASSIIDPVSSALHLSLISDDKKQNELLDNRLISSAKSVLLSKIEFEEVGSYQANHLDDLKSRYIILKPDKRSNDDKSSKKDSVSSFSSVNRTKDGLPSPKKVLFPLSSVRLGWESGWQVGSGMQNVGNTCYLNSTLQALFHVPAFANWLMSETRHADKCIQNGGCVICGMRKTLVDTQNSSGPIKPWQVYSKLRYICRHLTPGRQEDAHEFLRYLVESMEKSYIEQLGPGVRLEQWSKETTPLNQILGGYLRSAVRCLSCSHVSTTFQHFQDLLVDARRASTLDEALDAFFSKERLEDLGYKCESCNKKVSATKQFFIERAPMVLCIALKRFSLTGGKLSKHVQFKTKISLKKFMSHQGGQNALAYRLVSVVTHLGASQNCGHYTAVGLGPGGVFYQFDDSCVKSIPVSNVLSTNAYIMFYELEKCDIHNGNKMNRQSPAKLPIITKKETEENSSPHKKLNFIGPVLPDKNKENSPIKSIINPIKLNVIVDNGKPSTSESSLFKSTSYRGDNSFSSPNKSSSTSHYFSLGDSSSHNNSANKMNGSKLVSSDNTLFTKTITSVLSPNKSNINHRNGLQGNTAPISEHKIGPNDYKHAGAGDYSKSTDNLQSINNCNDYKLKIKVNDDNYKYNLNKTSTNNNGNASFNIKSQPFNNNSSYSNQNGNKSDTVNGSNGSRKVPGLVPYELESGGENQEDEEDEDENSFRNKLSAPKPHTAKTTAQDWIVSTCEPPSHHSPSLNGVVNSKPIRSSDAYNEQPTVKSNKTYNGNGNGNYSNINNGGSNMNCERRDILSQLQRVSHRGYGAPVNTWNGTHAQLNRQVYEDKKNQLKRAAEEDDEMDRGRQKKMRHNNYNYNKFYHNGNGFQYVQNYRNNWDDKQGRGNRVYFNKNGRHRPRGRFNNQHHSRHHPSSNRYHHYNNRKNR